MFRLTKTDRDPARPARASLLRDTRGSIFIEAVIFIPLLALIWVLVNYEYRINKTGMATQEAARTCAWQYATRGCTGGPPPGCDIADTGRLDDSAIRALAFGAFETISAYLPFLVSSLESLHGDEIRATHEAAVDRPKVLGGTRHTRGSHAMLCNTRTRAWELPAVFVLTLAFIAPVMAL